MVRAVLMDVLFQHDPDSPTSATVEPARMRNESWLSAGSLVPRLSNSIERSRTWIRSANVLSSCSSAAGHAEPRGGART